MKINVSMEIKDFTVPNFVVPITALGERQDGITFSDGIPLSDLDSETLEQLCTNFRASVFKKAGKPLPKLTFKGNSNEQR